MVVLEHDKSMNNALAGTVSSLENSTESTALCSYYAQVERKRYNPHYVRELCKEDVVAWLSENGYEKTAGRITTCGTSFMQLGTPKNEGKYARLRCKNELCPICGAKDSGLHKRRVRRASLRLLWNGLLGYFVFTIPSKVSNSQPDRKLLEELTKEAWEIVKKNFDTAGGLSRVHMMGEDPGKLHIHINFCFPLLNENNMGLVSEEVLKNVRMAWTEVLNKMFNLNIVSGKSNFKYKFADVIGMKINKIKYTLRPIVTADKFVTLKDEDKHYIMSFKGWHNTRWHGDLRNNKYRKYLTEKGIDVKKIEADIEGILSPLGERYRPIRDKRGKIKIISEQELLESPFIRRNYRWVDNDTLVDLGTAPLLSAQSPGG